MLCSLSFKITEPHSPRVLTWASPNLCAAGPGVTNSHHIWARAHCASSALMPGQPMAAVGLCLPAFLSAPQLGPGLDAGMVSGVTRVCFIHCYSYVQQSYLAVMLCTRSQNQLPAFLPVSSRFQSCVSGLNSEHRPRTEPLRRGMGVSY